jgi:hypothetical protein
MYDFLSFHINYPLDILFKTSTSCVFIKAFNFVASKDKIGV